MSDPRTRPGRGIALLAAAATALGGSALLLGPAVGSASSHREAPMIINQPLYDNTDVYAFVSPDDPDTTTLIANWIPFQEPQGGPNFYPFAEDAQYDIKVDNNGDAQPDITYRWTFTNIDNRGTETILYNNGPVNSFDDPTLLFKQTYRLESIDAAGVSTTLVEQGKVAPSYVGDASMPNYAALRDEAVTPLPDGGLSFAGQADDPFFLDLRVFDLLYGGDLSQTGDDTLTGFNVNSLAVQVPTASLLQGDDPVIGVWSTTQVQATRTLAGDGTAAREGEYVQVSRLGNPLVNELVVPSGLKDAFNALQPAMDADVPAVVAEVNDPEVPMLVEQIYGIPAPEAPRDDLFAIFLTGVEGLNRPAGEVRPAELLRLNTSIPVAEHPNRLGVLAQDTQGFPNGRRLTDDVVDIELQALEGAVRTGELVEALAAGDGVDANDREFGESFPYLALPYSGSDPSPHDGGSSDGDGSTPSGGIDAGAGGTAAPTGAPAPVLPMTLAGLGALLGAAGLWSLRRRATAGGDA